MTTTILIGDCRTRLAEIDECSVQTVVTSPPYFGLRDYGMEDQIGLESTPDGFVQELVQVFRAVHRVLKDDGTVWLNLGDSYAQKRVHEMGGMRKGENRPSDGLKPKDLIGIPWRVAFALQADGWYLRQDIIWHKPNPMPESVNDRCTKAHEYVFLLSKSARYHYNAEAIAEPVAKSTIERITQPTLGQQKGSERVPGKTNGPMKAVGPKFGGNKYGESNDKEHRTKSGNVYDGSLGLRNARSVWSITTQPFKGSHFATMPPELARRCILAGSNIGDTVLDPFGGAGTTALAANRLKRHAILCELNPDYAKIAQDRLGADAGMFSEVVNA